MTVRTPPRRRAATALPLLVTASLVLAACGTNSAGQNTNSNGQSSINIDDCENPDAATKKITDTITVGYSAPLSGPVAGATEFARIGYKARIAAANAAGGINGVKIKIVFRDDALQPDRAKSNVTEFIQKDKVDIVSAFGSGPVGAMVDDQNAACVPMLYPTSNEPDLNDVEAYPWTVQFLPSADAETGFMVKYLKTKVSDPKIGIVANVTATGKAFSDAFEKNAEKGGLKVIENTADTDPNAAATTMKAAGANVVFHAGTAGACSAFDVARARVGYQPDLEFKSSNCVAASEYISGGKAADGIITARYIKDPADPALSSDPGVKKYLEQIGDVDDPNNATTVLGWFVGDLLVNTLTQAADSADGLTRQSIIEAARDQSYSSPVLIDDIAWVATPDKAAGVNGFMPYAWNAADKKFVSAGEVYPVE